LRGLILFLLVIAGALFTGALLSYPLYLAVSLFGNPGFGDLILLSTQICGLLFGLLYLRYTVALNLYTIGLEIDGPAYPPQFSYGFLAGLLILVTLALALLGLDIYNVHTGREMSPIVILRLLAGALLTGLAVALFEETVFRGALLRGLAEKTGTLTALITTSLLYAAVHFIDYREPDTIGWLSAVQQLPAAFSQLISAASPDAFLSLLVLGLLLGIIRIRTGNIIHCIGLHAGLVAGVKLFRFFLEYNPAGRYGFLVSGYDYRLGYMSLAVLGLATIGYAVFFREGARAR